MAEAKLLSGNDACVQGALAAGVRFFAGYPITPSTEIANAFARELPGRGGIFMQMEDEIASMGAIIGASCTGTKAVTATSGPGFSLMQENIGYAAVAEIPCVIINVMRYGPSTGLPTSPSQGDFMQTRWGPHGDHPVIVIAPYTAREAYRETGRAVNLSERYRVPVIVLMDEILGHLRERVEFRDEDLVQEINRKGPDPDSTFLPYEYTEDGVPPFANFGTGYRYHITGLIHDETGFPTNNPVEVDRIMRRVNEKIELHRRDIARTQFVEVDDADILVVAFGSVARSAHEAVRTLRQEGKAVGMVRPVTVWPFPDEDIRKAAAGKKAVIVPEMNLGQMVREVERVVAGTVPVHALNRIDGLLITPQEMRDLIEDIQ
ncbi:MAG: 2-oxoglutarate ferredoxin oxidoreductase subunit alpha [delta proteobacterium MLS_D]|jgi:2-oxoglutarate/2-oxoacid ferredoxin oxidoreductase subunit alpha|nr:MAG: 2-oxoglutarate ferredoxin oxidoreductase subunit alpha [delta proteobacterium MLS_D]